MLTMVRAQGRQAGLGAMKGAVEGDIENGAPLGVVHLGKRLFPPQRSIVDEDVDAAEPRKRGIHHRPYRLLIGNVADMSQGLAFAGGDLAGNVLCLGAVAAHIHQYSGAGVGKRQRNGAADIASRTGDDRDLAGQFLARHGNSRSNHMRNAPRSMRP
jgi:hypothetical protein